jgi:hypothetical protein
VSGVAAWWLLACVWAASAWAQAGGGSSGFGGGGGGGFSGGGGSGGGSGSGNPIVAVFFFGLFGLFLVQFARFTLKIL